MTDEEYVRAHWKHFSGWIAPTKENKNSFAFNLGGPWFDSVFDSCAEAWSAAAEFTRERLEQIRQVYEEIATTRVDLGFAKTEHTRRVYSSILVREEAALAELKRGMK